MHAKDAGCSKSRWLDGLIGQFDPGDTAARYHRLRHDLSVKVLDAQPDASVVIVETGFLTCLSGLLASPADSRQPDPRAPMLLPKAKVVKLVIMGGAYPAGQEYNFANAPAETASVLSDLDHAERPTRPHGSSASTLAPGFNPGRRRREAPPSIPS